MKISHHGYQRCCSQQPYHKNRTAIKGKLSKEKLSSRSWTKKWTQVVIIPEMWTEHGENPSPRGSLVLHWNHLRGILCVSHRCVCQHLVRRTVRIRRWELRRGGDVPPNISLPPGRSILDVGSCPDLYDWGEHQYLISTTNFYLELIRHTWT